MRPRQEREVEAEEEPVEASVTTTNYPAVVFPTRVLCHICCVIQSMFELKIETRFWEETPSVRSSMPIYRSSEWWYKYPTA